MINIDPMNTYTNNVDVVVDDILKYRETNKNILEKLIPFIDKNMNNKKYRNNHGTWKREAPIKTNWLLANKLNQTESTKLYSSMNDLLNKVSETNVDTVASSMLKLQIQTRDQMTHLVDIIIDESTKNHKFTKIYAKLCHKLMTFYIIHLKNDNQDEDNDEDKIHFRDILLTRCQEIFEENIEKIDDVDKIKLLGLAGMIGELYNLNILPSSVMLLCFNELYNNIHKNPPNVINALCSLINISGKEYFRRDYSNAELCLHFMTKIKDDESTSRREKYLVMDLIDLKKKESWGMDVELKTSESHNAVEY